MSSQVSGIRPWASALAPSLAKRVAPLLFASLYAPAAAAEPEPTSPAPQDQGRPTAAAKEAEGHFARARQLFDEGDHALALIEFQRAYDLSPNYRVLYNIGQVEIQLFHYAAARVALEKFLSDGGAEVAPQRRAQAEQDLRMLGERTAFLRVVTIPPADVVIDDQAPIPGPFPKHLLVNAGQRKIVVSRPGYLTVTRAVTLAGGDDKEIDIDLVPVPEAPKPVVVLPPSPAPTHPNFVPAAIGWSATGALAIGAAIVGGVYLGKQADIDALDDPKREVSRKTADDAAASAKSLAITADILGLAAIGTGLLSLYFTLRPPHAEATASSMHEVRAARSAWRLYPTPAGLAGTF